MGVFKLRSVQALGSLTSIRRTTKFSNCNSLINTTRGAPFKKKRKKKLLLEHTPTLPVNCENSLGRKLNSAGTLGISRIDDPQLCGRYDVSCYVVVVCEVVISISLFLHKCVELRSGSRESCELRSGGLETKMMPERSV